MTRSNVQLGGQELKLDADADTSITVDTDDQIDFKVGGNDTHVFDANGHVTFKQFLDAGTAGGRITGASNRGNAARINLYQSGTGSDGGEIRLETANTSNSLTERVRITNGGALFVGTTSGSIGTSAFGCNIGNGTDGFAFSRNVTSSACMQIFGSNGEFRIIGNGNASNTNNSYAAISDLNLKENIADSGSQWDDIKAVKVKKYSLKKDKADKANMIGVIAQDLEASGMAGLVEEYEHEDTSANWKKTGEVTKTVKYSILYMKAIKALQEAMTRIETLEAEVAKLKG